MKKKSLFLLTENDVKQDTVNKIKKSENTIVIPLTFKTIKILEKNKIKFLLVDDLISPKDYELIDQTSYNIGRKWWKQGTLNQIFDYKGINTAVLLEAELIPSLLKLLHRIFLIEKIILKFKPDIVYFSNSKTSISKIPEIFQQKYNFLIENLDSNSNEKNFRHDDYLIGFDILDKTINIKISRKNFFRVKKYYQFFWDLLYAFSTIKRKQKNGKNILLLDFNLITNKSLLESLSDSEFCMFLANTRRPLVWNKLSLKIAKNLNFNKIKLDNEATKLHPNVKAIIENFKQFIEKHNSFTEIFSISGTSFWELYKNNFIEFCTKRISETLFLIDSLNQLLDNEKIDLLLTMDDFTQIERTVVMVCKQRKIPTIFLYSTIINVINDGKRNWEVYMIHKIIADKLAISGDMAKQVSLNNDVDPNKIAIIGNPRYDDLFRVKKSSKSNMILVALSGLPSTAWSSFFSLSFIMHYEKLIREIFTSLAKYDKNVIVKLHPTQDPIIDVQDIASQILPKAKIYKNANTYELISKSDVVISPPSTVITESLILNKPVLLIKYVENDQGIPYEEFNALLAVDSYHDIDIKIKQILSDTKIRDNLSIGRKNFLNYALDYHGSSSQQLIKLIQSMIKN